MGCSQREYILNMAEHKLSVYFCSYSGIRMRVTFEMGEVFVVE